MLLVLILGPLEPRSFSMVFLLGIEFLGLLSRVRVKSSSTELTSLLALGI